MSSTPSTVKVQASTARESLRALHLFGSRRFQSNFGAVSKLLDLGSRYQKNRQHRAVNCGNASLEPN